MEVERRTSFPLDKVFTNCINDATEYEKERKDENLECLSKWSQEKKNKTLRADIDVCKWLKPILLPSFACWHLLNHFWTKVTETVNDAERLYVYMCALRMSFDVFLSFIFFVRPDINFKEEKPVEHNRNSLKAFSTLIRFILF